MKIAVCLSGQPRNFREGYSYFSQAFISHEVDYFIHHWFHNDETEDPIFILSGGTNEGRISWIPEKDTDKKMIELFKPKSYLFEKRKEFTDHKYSKEFMKMPTPDALSMFYSRNECAKLFDAYLKENNTKYDLTISTRPDVAIFPQTDLSNQITDSDFIYTAYVAGNEWNNGQVNPALIASSSSNISYFLKMYVHYKALMEKGVPFCDHRLSFAHLEKLKRPFKQILVNEDGTPEWAWIRKGELRPS